MTATDNSQVQRRWLPWAPKAITQSWGGESFFPRAPGAQKPGQVGACDWNEQNGTGGHGQLHPEERQAPGPWLQNLALGAGRWPAQARVRLWLQCRADAEGPGELGHRGARGWGGGLGSTLPWLRAPDPAALGWGWSASSTPHQPDLGQVTCPLWDLDPSSVEWVSQPHQGRQKD